MSRSFVLLSFLAIAAPGCCFGGSADATPTSTDPLFAPAASPTPTTGSQIASCDVIPSISACRDMSGAAFALGEEFVRGFCSGGYTAGGTCPVENRVGTCDDGSGTLRRYYSTGGLPYTAETAQTDCAIFPGSTFTPN